MILNSSNPAEPRNYQVLAFALRAQYSRKLLAAILQVVDEITFTDSGIEEQWRHVSNFIVVSVQFAEFFQAEKWGQVADVVDADY